MTAWRRAGQCLEVAEPRLTIAMYCGQFNDRNALADWTLVIGLSERPAFNAIDACP